MTIAEELWRVAERWPTTVWAVQVSDPALDFTIEVATQMGLRGEFLEGRTADGEVLSEAIEAAEALGL